MPTSYVLKPDNLSYKGWTIHAWRYEPKRPVGTLIYLPGFETHGEMYEEHLDVFWRHRILVLELYLGSHPIKSVHDGLRLFMTYYRHKSKEVDLEDHILGGYSVGGLIAAHLAADTAGDHLAPQWLLLESPAIPGLGIGSLEYALRFAGMARKLRNGAEGEAGQSFARERGWGFVGSIGKNFGRSHRLLTSINESRIPNGSISVPTRAILCADDEFFPVKRSERWIKEICRSGLTTRIARIAGSHARILHTPEEANSIIRADLREEWMRRKKGEPVRI